MKTAAISLKLSPHLYEAVKAEAKKRDVPMAAYIRAVLAHNIFSKETQPIIGEEWLIKSKDGDMLLDV
jgi:hypothetical protein